MYQTRALHGIELFTAIRSDRPIPRACKAWSELLSRFGGVLHIITDNSFPVVPGAGFKVTVLDKDVLQLPTWNEICEVISHNRELLITGYVNSDILPDINIMEAVNTLQQLSTSLKYTRTAKPNQRFKVQLRVTHGWFAVATRVDINLGKRIGVTHTNGGYDIWLWNNIPDDNSVLGEYFSVPEFHIARPYFDMWFLSAAIQSGHRHVIDISPAVKLLHINHVRSFEGWSERVRVANDDIAWNKNHDIAFTKYCNDSVLGRRCVEYKKGTGTVCETPLQLTEEFRLRERDDSVPYKCLKRQTYRLSDEEYGFFNNI